MKQDSIEIIKAQVRLANAAWALKHDLISWNEYFEIARTLGELPESREEVLAQAEAAASEYAAGGKGDAE